MSLPLSVSLMNGYILKIFKKLNKIKSFKKLIRHAWVVQSVRHLTLGFSSGHDLRVMLGSQVSAESAWDSLLLSLLPTPGQLVRAHSLPQINKYILKK